MPVFLVRKASKDPKGAFYWINFECDAQTVDELAETLSKGKLIVGDHLITGPTADPRKLEVKSRRRVAFAAAGVASIEEPSIRFEEEERSAA